MTESDALLRLLVAAGLTAALGLERELRGHEAGLRTYTVVGVGAALFTAIGPLIVPGGDPTRIAAQIVSGVGFIGGGLIFRDGARTRNLTTAAEIWAVAAVGMAAGARLFLLAGGATLLILVALNLFLVVERRMKQWPGHSATHEVTEHEA